MNRCLWSMMALISWISATPINAANGPFDHKSPPQTLMVEHAEILLSDADGSTAEGFLTIWNGTQGQVSLESIRSDTFGKISVVRTELGSASTSILPIEEVLSVPGHAELTMRVNGIRLRLEERSPSSTTSADSRLTLVFQGGQELQVTADIVRSRDQLTIHHHGQGDSPVD